MDIALLKKSYKTAIRQVKFNHISTGGENSLAFMHSENSGFKPLIAAEILVNIPNNLPENLLSEWEGYNPANYSQKAIEAGADILAVKFNIGENVDSEILKSIKLIEEVAQNTDIPLIILGSERKEIDIKLIPALAKAVNKSCTFGLIDEDNYKELIPLLKDHNVIARTPIDINLAKQLNILITELGFDPDKILIDPNIGGLGYGLDYAYSVIERIKLAALEGDTMLNMPIIAFAGGESWKTKEAKSENVPPEWGDIKTRAIAWECVTASSMLVAGANVVVMYHPEPIRYIKNFIKEGK